MDGPFLPALRQKVLEFASGRRNVPLVLVQECAQLGWCDEAGKLLDRVASSVYDYDLIDPLLDNGCIEHGTRVASLVVQQALRASKPESFEWMRGLAAALRLDQCDRVWQGTALIEHARKWSDNDVIALLRALEAAEGWRDSPAKLFVAAQFAEVVVRWTNEQETSAVKQAAESRPKPSFMSALFRRSDLEAEERQARVETRRRARDSAAEILRTTGTVHFLARLADHTGWKVAEDAVDRELAIFEAWRCYQRGSRAQLRKAHDEAATHFTQAADQFKRAGDDLWAGHSYRELGWSLCPDRNPKESWASASSAFDEAERIASMSNVKRTYAQAIYGKAWCSEPSHDSRSDWTKCIALYRRAAEAAQAVGDQVLEAEATNSLAWCLEPRQCVEVGDWATAAHLYGTAVDLWRDAKRPADMARSLFNQARAISRNDKSDVPEEARVLFDQVVSIRWMVGDRKGADDAAAWVTA